MVMHGGAGDLISVSVPGGQCAKITALMVVPGIIFHMIWLDLGLIVGTRMAWGGSAMTRGACALQSLLENRVMTIPERESKAHAPLVIADPPQAILVPTISPRSSHIM